MLLSLLSLSRALVSAARTFSLVPSTGYTKNASRTLCPPGAHNKSKSAHCSPSPPSPPPPGVLSHSLVRASSDGQTSSDLLHTSARQTDVHPATQAGRQSPTHNSSPSPPCVPCPQRLQSLLLLHWTVQYTYILRTFIHSLTLCLSLRLRDSSTFRSSPTLSPSLSELSPVSILLIGGPAPRPSAHLQSPRRAQRRPHAHAPDLAPVHVSPEQWRRPRSSCPLRLRA